MKRSDFLKSLATVFAAPALLATTSKAPPAPPKEIPKPQPAPPRNNIVCGDLIRTDSGEVYCVIAVHGNHFTARHISNGYQVGFSIPSYGQYQRLSSAFTEK